MTGNDRSDTWFQSFRYFLITKGWIYTLLIAGLCILYALMTRVSTPVFVAFGAIPLIITGAILIIKNAQLAFYVMFGLQFCLTLSTMFLDLKISVATIGTMLIALALLIARSIYKPFDWSRSFNGVFWLYFVWAAYCTLELANPNTVPEAWAIAIINYFIYPLFCAILAPITIRNIKGIYWLLIIWSVFVLLAAFKGYWQKSHGFSARDLYFLYVYGGAKTHLIWSGIRYFSCFTDAANFGVHMAMAMTTFGFSIFYVKSNWLKAYFAMVVLAATYCMFISGTRSAIIIPLAGLLFFIILSGNKKTFLAGFIALIGLILFFSFTTIGDGNQYVRKMRSAFRPTADASYQVRLANRERIKELMVSKPFGYGLGLSKGERFRPKERMPYPPDSWLVATWVETGIVGFVLYLLIHGALFAWCSWILLFKVMNKRLRGLLAAWLCASGGFFVAAYANDVMQYPNSIVVYTSFIICFIGPYLDKQIEKDKKKEIPETV